MLDQVLNRWGVASLPDEPPARLRALHAAHVRNVPFENVTKLLRAHDSPGADAARRTPAIFWSDHLARGTGGTCFAATEAFRALLAEAGLPAEPAFAELPREEPRGHVVLLVDCGGEPWLSDVGYALAAPLPLPGRRAARLVTPQYDLELRGGPGGALHLFTEDALGRRFRYRFRAEAAPRLAFEEAWRDTLRPDAPFLNRLALGRMGRRRRWLYRGNDEVVVLGRGGIRPRRVIGAAALGRWFGLPAEIISRARTLLPGGIDRPHGPTGA